MLPQFEKKMDKETRYRILYPNGRREWRVENIFWAIHEILYKINADAGFFTMSHPNSELATLLALTSEGLKKCKEVKSGKET